MPRHPALDEWADRVATRFPHLPRSLAFGLAAWSFGMVLAHARGLSAVACALAPILGRSANTARQRLRQPDQPAGRKRGATEPSSTRPGAPPGWSGGSPAGGPRSGWPWPGT
jgi:hypothetical protein